MTLTLTRNGTLDVRRELPCPTLPPGDPAAVAGPFSDPLDARSLLPEPEPIHPSDDYPERENDNERGQH